MSTPLLTLYSRQHCHLCQDMQRQLYSLQRELGFELAVVEIDHDAGLTARYGQRVPVLSHGETEICHYFLDLVALKACLAAV